MDTPTELFVRPLSDDDSLVAFNFPFQLQAKALEDGSPGSVVQEQDNGDLIIEGLAVSFDGIDRQDENFLPGCLREGLKAFMDGGAALCYHHKHDKVMGKVLEMEEVPGGVRAKARVDGAIKNHPELGALYQQVKNGTLNSYSLGGFFKRIMTTAGARIAKVDPTELSITAVPVLANGTQFSVIGGKALENYDDVSVRNGHAGNDGTTEIDGFLGQLSSSLDALAAALPEGKAVKPPKGTHSDHRAIATIIKLHQMSEALPDSTATDEDSNGKPYVNPKVAKLGEDVREHLKGHAKTAHELAAKLGPVPPDLDSDGM